MAHLQALSKWEFRRFVGGTSLLLMNAGFTNGCGMLGLSATLSHMTGVTTRIGTQLAMWNRQQVDIAVWSLLTYCSGVFLSGLIVGPRGKLKVSWRYSLPFMIEGICLAIVAIEPDYTFPAFSAKGLVAFAMGIQNGVTCGWSGGVGRSTHITGFLADITMVMAYMFYSLALADTWRLSMFIPFYFSFMFGAFLGGLTYHNLSVPRHAFLVPSIFCFIIATFIIAREVFMYKKGYHLFEEDKPKPNTTDNNTTNNDNNHVALAVGAGVATTGTAVVVVGHDPASSATQQGKKGELVEADGLESLNDFV